MNKFINHLKKIVLSPVKMPGILAILCLPFFAVAQEKPPRPISVYTAQNLSFGAFYQGITGGTVEIDYNGVRYSTGDVILAGLGYTFYAAIFEVEAEPGYLVNILNGPDATLSGSNGGSMILHVGNASTGNPFIVTSIPPGRTQVRIGGILTVGNPGANPPGNYSGSFSITFIQE
jgi:hypothetical protein